MMHFKNKKEFVALLATAALTMGLLAGCGSNETIESTSKEETKSAESSAAEVNSASKEEEKEFSYPMEGGKTITHLAALTGQQEAAGYDKYGDTEYAKAVAEGTGVDVEYLDYPAEFSIFIADGDYPDVMEAWWGKEYPGGLEGLGRDEVIIPLNDVIDQYMPNFKAWIENNPEDAKKLYTAEGIIYGIPFIYESSDLLNTTGLIIRKDWLDELGLDVPETIDDWHDVLLAFKEKKGVIPFTNQGTYGLSNGGFRLAYAAVDKYSIDPESGNIVFTQATDAYREFLETMNQWYEEGLIDPDIASLNYDAVLAKVNNGEVGAAWVWNAGMDNSEIELQAVAVPAKSDDAEIVHKGGATRVADYHAVISSQCEDVETAARYLDWFFTEEGVLTSNFGVEGISYTVENGAPVFTDEVLNNADGLSQQAAEGKYIRSYSAFPGIRHQEYEFGKYKTQATRDSYAIWGSVGTTEYRLPAAVKLPNEDSDRVKEIEAEVTTHVKEMCMKFILGTEDIDEKWDEYIDTLKKFELDEAVALYQRAYDSVK